MALALNRTGVVFKKCDRASHKPDSNKACAADTCQHTCSDVERCPHAWTLRYWAEGKQRERSFKDEVRHGRTHLRQRPETGAGRAAQADGGQARGRQDVRRLHESGQGEFGGAAEAFIMRLPVNDRSRQLPEHVPHARQAVSGAARSPAWRTTVTGAGPAHGNDGRPEHFRPP